MTDYLTQAEAAELLRMSTKTLANKVAAGVFKKGVHWFRPRGMTRRFKRSALVDFIEGDVHQVDDGNSEAIRIPTSRGGVMIGRLPLQTKKRGRISA